MSRKPEKKGNNGIVFLSLVLALYGMAFLVNGPLATEAFGFGLKLIKQLIPILVLVFALIFLSNLLIRPDWVRKHVGRESGLKGWAIAVISGIFSVGPVYPWYAVLNDLKAKGMRDALIAAFLYSRAIKLPLLPLVAHYFGLAFTIVLSCYLIVFAFFSGLLVERLSRGKS